MSIGQHVQTEDEPEAEVIGIVRDHRIGTIGEAPQSVIYYAFAQRPRTLDRPRPDLVVPDGLVASVQRAIDEVDATVPVSVQTLRNATSLEMNMRRLGTIPHGRDGRRWTAAGDDWPLRRHDAMSRHPELLKSASAWRSAPRVLASGRRCCCAR